MANPVPVPQGPGRVREPLASSHQLAQSRIHYWWDGAGHEVDFAIVAGRDRVAAVEAKISPDAFNARALASFRRAYPDGPNLLCCPFVDEPFQRRLGGFEVTVCAPWQVPERTRG